jgi:hypothetical protein
MANSEKSPLAVRLPVIEAECLRKANTTLKGPSFNRLHNDLTIETLRLVQANPFKFDVIRPRLLLRLRESPQVRAIFEEMRQRDVRRSVPNTETMSVKLPLSFTERQRIHFMADQLRWTVAQVILEALQTASVLISATEAIRKLPPLFVQFRGSMTYEGAYEAESASRVLGEVNKGLGLLGNPNLSPAPKPLEPMISYVDLI